MSRPAGCATCWSDDDVDALLRYAEEWIAAATGQLWPHTEVTFGPLATAGGALYRQVQAGEETLCGTVRPAGAPLSRLVRGDHGAFVTVLLDGDGGAANATLGQAEQLTALATYTRLRVTAPTATAKGVMFTPWTSDADLAHRLQTQPARLPEMVTALMDDLRELYRDPAVQLRQAATPGSLPRVLTDAMSHTATHLHADATVGEVGELRALAGSLSARLARLTTRLDPAMVTRSGLAFGNLSPRGVRYPDGSSRPVLTSPALEPGGDLVDIGTLLGHLHLLALGCPPPVRAELVEGLEAWLSGRLSACRDQWRGWLTVVLTLWAATAYDQVVTALTLPTATRSLNPATANLVDRPLPALSVLDVLTRELRRRGADAALNATLATLAASPADQPRNQSHLADR